MEATALDGRRDIGCEAVTPPDIVKPRDALVKIAATRVCGSGLRPCRGLGLMSGPSRMGHDRVARSDRSGRP